MKRPSVITVTMNRRPAEVLPWSADIKMEYEEPDKPERYLVVGHCPIRVLARCGDAIDRKLKQNETETLT